MSRVMRAVAIAALAFSSMALAVPEAEANGVGRQKHRHYARHHRHHVRHIRHRRLLLQSYEPQYERAFWHDWDPTCGYHRFVTYYGALAYRRVCS